MQDWNLADQIAGLENAGLENAGPENAGLESDELRLKQPHRNYTSTQLYNNYTSHNAYFSFFCNKVAT